MIPTFAFGRRDWHARSLKPVPESAQARRNAGSRNENALINKHVISIILSILLVGSHNSGPREVN